MTGNMRYIPQQNRYSEISSFFRSTLHTHLGQQILSFIAKGNISEEKKYYILSNLKNKKNFVYDGLEKEFIHLK